MFEQPNTIIRKTCKQYGIPLWALAHRLGMSEITLIRKLRIELSASRKNEILNVIYDIDEEHRKKENIPLNKGRGDKWKN